MPRSAYKILTGLAAIALTAAGTRCGPRDTGPVFPGASWAEETPEAAGLDPEKLDEIAELLEGRGCIVRDGYLVYQWGKSSSRHDLASAGKPICTHFLLVAVETGLIAGFDELVAAHEPRLIDLSRRTGGRDEEMTWRHLANQTACYQHAESPGTAFVYNDWQLGLLGDALFRGAYQVSYETIDAELLRPLLTDILQFEDEPTLLPYGVDTMPGRLAASPRDFARFGLLYLREGNWKGRQLVSPEHVRMVTSSPLPADFPRVEKADEAMPMLPGQQTFGSEVMPDDQGPHFGSYSWLWWVNGIDEAGKRFWEGVPEDTYAALGHQGARGLVVIPSLSLIMSWNRAMVNGRENMTRVFRLLSDAVVDP